MDLSKKLVIRYDVIVNQAQITEMMLMSLQKEQLLKLNMPATFMLVALDEGPGPPIKYQYPELGKLYAVVSQLIRCCDVSARCQSSAVASVRFNPLLSRRLYLLTCIIVVFVVQYKAETL